MINFSGKENVCNLIELERVSLMSTLDIQKNLNKQILIFVKNFMTNTKISLDINPSDTTFLYLNESTNYINKSNSNINGLKDLLTILDNLDLSNENLENEINEYNNKFRETMNFVYKNAEAIEKFVYQITTTNFSELSSTFGLEPSAESISHDVAQSLQSESESESKLNETTINGIPENTLIISDSQKKVILPFEIKKVKDIFQKNENKYNSIEGVINKLYTRPISYYRFSSISRFKEAYKLVKEREKLSTFKALGLAFELLGNYNLHPAIISSCKNLDELDIYLACLDDNTLDDFHFFDIKYEIPLALSKFKTTSALGISKLAKMS